jgi:hypothetical protein
MAYAACRSALGSQIGRKRPPRSRQCAPGRLPTIQYYSVTTAEFDGSICTHSRGISPQGVHEREVAWKGRVCVVRHVPVKRPDLRGRMRRLGAICTAAKSYTRLLYMKGWESCNIGVVYHLRRHRPCRTAFAHNEGNRRRVP